MLVAAVLSGCTADVNSKVSIEGSDVTSIVYTVTLSGELAEAVKENPETDQDILALLSEKTGSKVERTETSKSLVYRSSPSKAVWVGDLTGVSGVDIEKSGTRTTAMLEVVTPKKLEEAIESAAKEEPDAKALSLLYKRSTTISMTVTMPDDIVEVVGLVPGEVEGREVRLSSSIDKLEPGPVRIVSEDSPVNIPRIFGFVLMAGALLYAVLSFIYRRNRR